MTEAGKAFEKAVKEAMGMDERAARWERVWQAAVAVLPGLPDLDWTTRFVAALDSAEALVAEWERRKAAEEGGQ